MLAPRTLEGALLWTIVDQSPGLLRVAPMGGHASVDWVAAREAAVSIGVDSAVVTELLPALEHALIQLASELQEINRGHDG